MRKLRVLVVDDSVVIRRMVREVVAADPELEVAGVAANGKIALAMVDQCTPDVVTLDIEMPEMDGLTALKEIRRTHPAVRIIMFSTLTERAALATLDALALGADDYVTKPSQVNNVSEGSQRIREQLIPKVKALCGRRAIPPLPAARIPAPALSRPTERDSRPDVVAIGTSTGGPNALAEILPRIPGDFPLPILIVQHMPPVFTAFLAERLSASSRIPVKEASPRTEIGPGQVWIAPGDFHLTVLREGAQVRLATIQIPPENSCRPSVDVLFRSVAEVYGARSLAVVLTGMGQDGLRGCERIREAGGQIVVQDEASSVVWGMPGAVANAGIADHVLPLAEIADEIIRRADANRSPDPGAAARVPGQVV
ncbi:MAG: chemotaxis response regulator protein-glutamate methylesterase [Terriglobales bacterium]